MRYNEVADHIANSNGPALTGLAARDSRITILTQPNLGTVAALHAGLRLCQAEFVAIQDADGGGARLSKKSYGLYSSVWGRETHRRARSIPWDNSDLPTAPSRGSSLGAVARALPDAPISHGPKGGSASNWRLSICLLL